MIFQPASYNKLMPKAIYPACLQGLLLSSKMSVSSTLLSSWLLNTLTPSTRYVQFRYFLAQMISGGYGQDLPSLQLTFLLRSFTCLMRDAEYRNWSWVFLAKTALMKVNTSCPTSSSSSCMYTTKSLGWQQFLEYQYSLLQSLSWMFSMIFNLRFSSELLSMYWYTSCPPSQLFRQYTLNFEQFWASSDLMEFIQFSCFGRWIKITQMSLSADLVRLYFLVRQTRCWKSASGGVLLLMKSMAYWQAQCVISLEPMREQVSAMCLAGNWTSALQQSIQMKPRTLNSMISLLVLSSALCWAGYFMSNRIYWVFVELLILMLILYIRQLTQSPQFTHPPPPSQQLRFVDLYRFVYVQLAPVFVLALTACAYPLSFHFRFLLFGFVLLFPHLVFPYFQFCLFFYHLLNQLLQGFALHFNFVDIELEFVQASAGFLPILNILVDDSLATTTASTTHALAGSNANISIGTHIGPCGAAFPISAACAAVLHCRIADIRIDIGQYLPIATVEPLLILILIILVITVYDYVFGWLFQLFAEAPLLLRHQVLLEFTHFIIKLLLSITILFIRHARSNFFKPMKSKLYSGADFMGFFYNL